MRNVFQLRCSHNRDLDVESAMKTFKELKTHVACFVSGDALVELRSFVPGRRQAGSPHDPLADHGHAYNVPMFDFAWRAIGISNLINCCIDPSDHDSACPSKRTSSTAK